MITLCRACGTKVEMSLPYPSVTRFYLRRPVFHTAHVIPYPRLPQQCLSHIKMKHEKYLNLYPDSTELNLRV
jgi:hypothetical protein